MSSNMSLDIYPASDARWDMAFGWVKSDAIVASQQEKDWIFWNNAANIAGYVLSPIIGLIRIAVNAYFLEKREDAAGRTWTPEANGYFQAQIARGVAEVFGGGYVLWIVDIIASIYHNCPGK